MASYIGKRYRIERVIGRGGMGVVYCALDRLNGAEVALKHVSAAASASEHNDQRLALANEFRALASLRHPNVIAVLDYGFDEERQPYFTMPLVDGGRDLLTVSGDVSFDEKLDYLLQILQAVVYLHRRQVLHRDLKSDNILIDGGRAKVMDFGLASVHSTHDDFDKQTVGTLAYMAPELLQGQPATVKTDIYALGMIAYELFTGAHPFALGGQDIISQIMMGEIDFSGLPEPLAAIFAEMLERDPVLRYQSAAAIMDDLCEHFQRRVPETAAIRDSFLQAASFVGREDEMALLRRAQAEAVVNRGGIWLVGGESGVGKSRLLEELRVRALVDGMTVLRGQALNTGGLTYQVWRDVIRGLLLQVKVPDKTAAMIEVFIPDVEKIIGRPVADASRKDPGQAQKQFFDAVSTLFVWLDMPVMILLEDLQWAEAESLELLLHLQSTVLSDAPVFILGSYRDDEAPNLPEMLPTAKVMGLKRLPRNQIEALAASMLGDRIGRRADLVDLLENETEGNVFFIVEVVRTLADEAGSLDRIGQMSMPRSVFAEGMKTVIQRRLGHIRAEHYPLLKLAAVAGRYLDLELLEALDPQADLVAWLNAGAEVAVLEVQEDQWRFAHDKLRERLLEDLTAAERPKLHAQVATAIESLRREDQKQAARLAYHWRQAGDVAKETHSAEIAGNLALQMSANGSAAHYLERALVTHRALPEYPEKWRRELSLRLSQCVALTASKGYPHPDVEAAFNSVRDISVEKGDEDTRFRALYGLANVYSSRAELLPANMLADELLMMAADYETVHYRLMAHAYKAGISLRVGTLKDALYHAKVAVSQYDIEQHRSVGIQYGDDPGLSSLSYGALVLALMGFTEQSVRWRAQALGLAEALDYPFGKLFARYYAGALSAVVREEYDQALADAQAVVALAEQYNYPFYRAMSLMSWATAEAFVGETESALARFERGIELWASLGAPRQDPHWQNDLAKIHWQAGNLDAALEILNAGIARGDELGETFLHAEYYSVRGRVLLAAGAPFRRAEADLRQAIEIAGKTGAVLSQLQAAVALAEAYVAHGNYQAALAVLSPIVRAFIEGFDTPLVARARVLQERLTARQ